MKGHGRFGAPKQQRFSMQFGYDARPSFWRGVKSNAHLIIAAVGTAALLGIAGTALWLAMPAGEQRAFAQPDQPERAAEAKPAEIKTPSQPALASAAPAAPHSTPKGDALSPAAADAEFDLAALPANDPRWSGSTHKQARAPIEIDAPAAKQAASALPVPAPTPELAASVAAYQPAEAGGADEPPAHSRPDKAETAAIPATRPEAPPKTEQDATVGGRILRDVTIRSGPRNRASAIGTIPARASVRVISCKSWCEVVYKGRRGFIYKSFLDSPANGGSGSRDQVRTKSIDAKPPVPAKAKESVVPDPMAIRRESGVGHT